jgi:DNA-directed RNA polymerase specialized sigma24 family protein
MSSNSTTPSGSVTENLQKLQHGGCDDQAQKELFQRYYGMVVEKARKRVRHLGVADESDVAMSVWSSVFRGLAEGKHECRDREEFEELLGQVTFHKAVNLFHWVKRPRRHPSDGRSPEEILAIDVLDDELRKIAELHYLSGQTVDGIGQTLCLSRPTVVQRLASVRRWLQKHRYRPNSFAEVPADFASVEDSPIDVLLFEELVESLDESMRRPVLLKLQGFDNRRIAEELNVTVRQVERRLKLLRDTLMAELQSRCVI